MVGVQTAEVSVQLLHPGASTLGLQPHAIVCCHAERLLVILRDGRKLIGILRSFDQFGKGFDKKGQHVFLCPHFSGWCDSYFRLTMPTPCAANVVIEGAVERVIVGSKYCDLPLGLYIIRGENVVLIGALVCTSTSPLFVLCVPLHITDKEWLGVGVGMGV